MTMLKKEIPIVGKCKLKILKIRIDRYRDIVKSWAMKNILFSGPYKGKNIQW